MSDEPIVEYLRSRAQVRPPMDLAGSIADAVAGVPQQRHSWFAPLMPAAAAVAAAGVVVVAAILVGQGPNAGPPPGGSPTQADAPSVTPSPTPAPTLLRPGDTVTIDAVDPDGRWGTVTLFRGDDLGGYDDGSVPDDSFVVEIHVQYLAERQPNPAEFGASDWTLVGGPDGRSVGNKVPPGGRREATRPTLGTYPGAIDIFSNALDGWLLFEVPRDAAEYPLELRYQPTGLAEIVTAAYVRRPGPAPDPVALASPPAPEPVSYVERDGYPFGVIDNAEADELFATPDTCTNTEAGYTITYPDAWFTNTEIGDWPACSWFSPTFFNVGDDPNMLPPQIAIVVTVEDMSFGFTCEPDATVDEPVTVAGFEGNRMEYTGCLDESGAQTPEVFSRYEYTVIVAPQPAEVPTMRARTFLAGAADYELNRAVLDRIMALIEFGE